MASVRPLLRAKSFIHRHGFVVDIKLSPCTRAYRRLLVRARPSILLGDFYIPWQSPTETNRESKHTLVRSVRCVFDSGRLGRTENSTSPRCAYRRSAAFDIGVVPPFLVSMAAIHTAMSQLPHGGGRTLYDKIYYQSRVPV